MLCWPILIGFYLFQLQTQLSICCLARSEAAQSCSSCGDAPDQTQPARDHMFCLHPKVLLASIRTVGRVRAGWLIAWGDSPWVPSVILPSHTWGISATCINDAFWSEWLSSYRSNRVLIFLSPLWLWDYHLWILTYGGKCEYSLPWPRAGLLGSRQP